MPARPLFNYDKIAKAYKVFGSTRKVARIIGCSNFTVSVVARRYGLTMSLPGTHDTRGMTGTVARWMKAHPEVKVPLTPRGIESVVGCRRADAYHYLERKRFFFKKKAGRLPDLASLLGEPYALSLDNKHFRVVLTLSASKRTVILYEDELDAILLRLSGH